LTNHLRYAGTLTCIKMRVKRGLEREWKNRPTKKGGILRSQIEKESFGCKTEPMGKRRSNAKKKKKTKRPNDEEYGSYTEGAIQQRKGPAAQGETRVMEAGRCVGRKGGKCSKGWRGNSPITGGGKNLVVTIRVREKQQKTVVGPGTGT